MAGGFSSAARAEPGDGTIGTSNKTGNSHDRRDRQIITDALVCS
jgi:hypothetical protein